MTSIQQRAALQRQIWAIANDVPEPARDADAAAAGIALSAVAGTVAANYQACHENAEQLRALHAWVREVRAAEQAPSSRP